MPYRCDNCGNEDCFFRDNEDEVDYIVTRRVEIREFFDGNGDFVDTGDSEDIEDINEEYSDTIGTLNVGDMYCDECGAEATEYDDETPTTPEPPKNNKVTEQGHRCKISSSPFLANLKNRKLMLEKLPTIQKRWYLKQKLDGDDAQPLL